MRTALPSAAVATVLLSGCGGGTTTKTTTAAQPAPAAITAATSPAPAASSEATTPTTAAAPTGGEASGSAAARKDAITVKGRTGDTLTLLGQYATSAAGTPKARVKVKVTLKGTRGPFSGYNLAAGHKLIGLDLRVTNVGGKRFDDALPGGMLILVGGESGKQTSLISGSSANPCPNPSLKLKQGQSKDVCIAFDVPTRARLQTFQFSTDSGYGDTGLWRLR